MSYTSDFKLDPDTIRAFVRDHMARNQDTNPTYMANGFRVKFGRPMSAAEAPIANAIYAELDLERQARWAAEAQEAEARRPKGFHKILASGWKSQAAVGTIVSVSLLYALAGVELASQIMFYIVGVTQGFGAFFVVGVGWALAASVVGLLRKVFRYTVPVVVATALARLVDGPVPELVRPLA